ncbi:4-hydroxy-tetrahydrodipicolinate reductase [Enterococcus rivorum]|uniref:4-hydroxy-tetrahydrodipicolinate reductase n=1 Tax=Enterococcus rivorum TaxID=762845 RepID=A0A1E5KXT2_9ENTE|nr:4-hydroxy-tetrahydrodipicolinate reductase [Enterococcus rivorum]MBP2099685.1 4-hydroxy-tetrahydrodipicolinate reductase [Enterococcus rivorum]OEH82710.1 4-hydroxy-tetrahydrodipicolinate reductase [Enterococcus rivorum]
MIRIVVAGFKGKMGSTATKMVIENENFELVGVLDPFAKEENLKELPEYHGVDVPVFKDKNAVLSVSPEVWIDFTIPKVTYENTKFAIEHHISPVVGTTGLTEEQLKELIDRSKELQVGGLIAPNFAIGAVLMMQFAKKAAEYFPDVEIIELHHDNKLDAPSGTGLKTAEMMAEVRKPKKQGHPEEEELIAGARGADFEGMKIHSVRLPGLIAHQQVQFGGVGEGLTIRHDSYDRSSFMSGVALGCEKVVAIKELVYGLENLL